MEERRIENRRWLLACAACKYKNKIWISSMSYNGLYCYDTLKDKTKFIGSFPNEKSDAWRLHGKAIVVGHEICFVPDTSRYIHFFNMDTEEIDVLEIGGEERITAQNAVEQCGHVFFLGRTGKIYDVDVRNKTLVQTELPDELRNARFCSDMVILNNSIYWADMRSDTIIEFSTETKQIKVWDCKTNGNGFGTLAYGEGFFWLTTESGIYKWNKSEGLMKISENYPAKFGMKILDGNNICSIDGFVDVKKCGEKPFSFSYYAGGFLWLFPFRTNMVVKMDIETGKISEVCMENEEEDEVSLHLKDRVTHCHYLSGSCADSHIFISTKTKSIYEWEICDNRVSSRNYIMWVNSQEYLETNIIVFEGVDGTLKEFMNAVKCFNNSDVND